MKRVLMIAFHFPPLAGSSGIQRTLRFVQHLPALGWEPVVLTAHPRAYERTSEDLLGEVAPNVKVVRAFALDTARHLSIGGRYPGFLARPDRWQSWRFGGVLAGLRMVGQQRFDAVWSTYPIATAHQIAAALHSRTRLPWIADFRDPMAQDRYPADPRTWRSFKAIEEHAIRTAARSVFTTRGAADLYRKRYPSTPADRIVVIENGYDDDSFAAIEGDAALAGPLDPGRITLLHSGVVYPNERDPSPLIHALAMLKADGTIHAGNFSLRFRASANDASIDELARSAGVRELIQLLPPIPYREALLEMMRADALLAMQSAGCNAQIPAKLYEYLRARRPILGLTDPLGDTAQALLRAGVRSIAPLDSAHAIAELLGRFVKIGGGGIDSLPTADAIQLASRDSRAREFAGLLNQTAS